MARTKRKVKGRGRPHVKVVRAARKRRIRMAGGRRCVSTRSARRARVLARKTRRK